MMTKCLSLIGLMLLLVGCSPRGRNEMQNNKKEELAAGYPSFIKVIPGMGVNVQPLGGPNFAVFIDDCQSPKRFEHMEIRFDIDALAGNKPFLIDSVGISLSQLNRKHGSVYNLKVWPKQKMDGQDYLELDILCERIPREEIDIVKKRQEKKATEEEFYKATKSSKEILERVEKEPIRKKIVIDEEELKKQPPPVPGIPPFPPEPTPEPPVNPPDFYLKKK